MSSVTEKAAQWIEQVNQPSSPAAIAGRDAQELTRKKQTVDTPLTKAQLPRRAALKAGATTAGLLAVGVATALPARASTQQSTEETTYRSQTKEVMAAASGQRIVRAHRIFQTEVGVSGANRHSSAVAALTEVAPDPGGDVPFVAGATMKVYNVAPQDNGVVVVRGEVDWDDDLNVRVSVIIL